MPGVGSSCCAHLGCLSPSLRRNRIRHVLQQMPTLPEGAHLGLAGGGAGQPPVGSSSSSSSSSSAGVASSDSVPSIIDDILRLQQRCQAAAEQQRALGGALLRRAVQHTSAEDLPCAPPKRPLNMRQKLTQAQLKRQWLERQPWFLNWDRRLAEVRQLLGCGGAHALGQHPSVNAA